MKGKVARLIREIGRRRGRKNESAVNAALAEMKEEGEIASFYKTDRHADKFLGIDFYIVTLEDGKVPLQVKSSLGGKKAHEEKFPNVPVIIVEAGESSENIKNKIRGVLEQHHG